MHRPREHLVRAADGVLHSRFLGCAWSGWTLCMVKPHLGGRRRGFTTHTWQVDHTQREGASLLALVGERCSISTMSTSSCESASGTGCSVVLHSRMSVPDSVNSQAQFHSRSARHLHHTYLALAAREHACASSAIEFSAAGVRSRDYAASPDGRSAAWPPGGIPAVGLSERKQSRLSGRRNNQ